MPAAILLSTMVLCALLMLTAAEGRPTFSLGGKDGLDLFGQLANNSSLNSSFNSTSTDNSSINVSRNASGVSLGGEDGGILFQDLQNASKNLSDWGAEPPKAPKAPGYDARAAQTYQVLRMNHVGY